MINFANNKSSTKLNQISNSSKLSIPHNFNNSNDDIIFLKDWEWVNESYQIDIEIEEKKINKIILDPSGKMADVDKSNNTIEFE